MKFKAPLATALAVGIYLSRCVYPPAAALADEPPSRQLSTEEKEVIKHSISIGLKDPDPAKFYWFPVIVAPHNGDNGYCGFINAKNSYGGYTGIHAFYTKIHLSGSGVIDGSGFHVIGDEADNGLEDTVVKLLCSGFGYDRFRKPF